MIYIDSREGGLNQSTTVPKMLSILSSHRYHPPCTTALLPAADFFFSGNGPNSATATMGFERKSITGFIQDIHSGRLVAEQLPKLIDTYDYQYIIVEGQTKIDWESGELLEWGYLNGQRSWVPLSRKTNARKSVTYSGQVLLGAMHTISTFTPVTLIRTFNLHDTLDVIATLWNWWSKPYDQHHTLKKFHTEQTTVLIEKASFLRRVAAQLDKIGWEKSGTISSHFKRVLCLYDDNSNPDCLCGALTHASTPDQWEKLPGFGPVLSNNVVKQLKGEK